MGEEIHGLAFRRLDIEERIIKVRRAFIKKVRRLHIGRAMIFRLAGIESTRMPTLVLRDLEKISRLSKELPEFRWRV